MENIDELDDLEPVSLDFDLEADLEKVKKALREGLKELEDYLQKGERISD